MLKFIRRKKNFSIIPVENVEDTSDSDNNDQPTAEKPTKFLTSPCMLFMVQVQLLVPLHY
jgi:hypothetical protein